MHAQPLGERRKRQLNRITRSSGSPSIGTSSPADVVTSVYSAAGKQHGYMLRVARFAHGFAMVNFPVNVFDLPDRDLCDGLIGLNFLRQFNCQIRPEHGRVLLEHLAPLAA